MATEAQFKLQLKRECNPSDDSDIDDAVEFWWTAYEPKVPLLSDGTADYLGRYWVTKVPVLELAQGKLRVAMDTTIGQDSFRASQLFANISAMLVAARVKANEILEGEAGGPGSFESITPESRQALESEPVDSMVMVPSWYQ
jgi:hypothetical protein